MKKKLALLFALGSFFFTNSQPWLINGNSATNPDIHFVGTIDNKPLLFRINNKSAGQIDLAYNKTFFGYGAGRKVTTGTNNTAVGFKSLYSTRTAIGNTAYGAFTLYTNTGDQFILGCYNTAIGTFALRYNTTGYSNTALGAFALTNNNRGTANTAIGVNALRFNISGAFNVASGYLAMNANTGGGCNTAIGYSVLSGTTNSYYNTAIGYNAGGTYNLGWNNTLLGANANGSFADQYNIVAIGQGVTCPANSSARIGNSATTSIGGFAGWSNFSDGRFKEEIKEDVKGIDFIMKLRPITYRLDITSLSKQLNENQGIEWNDQMKKAIAEKEKMLFTGFVAQEVEAAAKETGYDFSGVDKPKNATDFYGLRYAEFVVPLAKAMQEQQQMIKDLLKQNTELQRRITVLEKESQNKLPPIK
jgi:hypothetical protein